MAINWGLGLGAPDAGQAFTAGWQQGGTQNALRRLVQNPQDAGAVNALAQFNPQAAMQVQQQQQAQAAAAREREVRMRAAQGDPQAMDQLAGIDWDAWSKLDEHTRKQVGEAVDFIGQAALQIDSLPEEARAQAWANYVQIAESRGMDIPTEYERYSPQVLSAALAESKQIKEALTRRDPKYQVIPEGGTLVNTRDPAALAQVAGQNAGPQAGMVEDGYRFRGGDPSNPQNWDPVGGGDSNVVGNFPGN